MRDETIATEPQVASLLRRVLALLIDGTIQSVLFLALREALGDPNVEETATVVLVILAGAIYNIGFLSILSFTPGKVALRIWVSDGQGGRIRPDQAILRHLIIAAAAISVIDASIVYFFYLLLGLSIVMVIIDPKRRALHDRIAGTLVVSGRPPPHVDEFGRVL